MATPMLHTYYEHYEMLLAAAILRRQSKAPFTLYNLTGLGTVPSPVWCNVNASDRARPTQISCGPGPPRGGGLGPDRRGSARYEW